MGRSVFLWRPFSCAAALRVWDRGSWMQVHQGSRWGHSECTRNARVCRQVSARCQGAVPGQGRSEAQPKPTSTAHQNCTLCDASHTRAKIALTLRTLFRKHAMSQWRGIRHERCSNHVDCAMQPGVTRLR